jgi:16S rRNA G966 N2-methylase RsmD
MSKPDLVALLEQRDRRDATRFGLVWEARDADRDASLNDDFVALDLDTNLSCGAAPWRNLIVEGDNYDALRHFRMAFAGLVKCIYIDPPYNTGNRDFVYNDRFVDREDGWRHSKWCDFMFRRLQLAKRLLAPDGAIFVSIDDNELAHLRLLMDRVFGAENFLATLVWEKGKKGDAKFVSVTHEYVLVYAASKSTLVERNATWRRRKEGVDGVLAQYAALRHKLGEEHNCIRLEMMKWYRYLPATDPAKKHKHYNYSDNRGLYFADNFHGPDDGRESRPRYDILHPITGKSCKKPSTGWRWEEERTKRALAEDPPRIHFGPDETTIPCRKSYLVEVDAEPFTSVFYRDGRSATLEVEKLVGKGEFSFPKDSGVIEELLSLCTGPDDLVLDFFAGSGTTAHAVHKMNAADGGRRRCILVSSTEATQDAPDKNLCRDVCAKRVRRVIEGFNGTLGLGGDFAYLRCRRVPAGRLLRLEHEAVWTALQLIHRDRLAPFDPRAPYQYAEDDGQALVYVPRFRRADGDALRQRLDSATAAAVFSWQPDALRQQIPGSHVQHESIAEFLARKFALGV